MGMYYVTPGASMADMSEGEVRGAIIRALMETNKVSETCAEIVVTSERGQVGKYACPDGEPQAVALCNYLRKAGFPFAAIGTI